MSGPEVKFCAECNDTGKVSERVDDWLVSHFEDVPCKNCSAVVVPARWPDQIWAGEDVVDGTNVWYARGDLGGTEYIRRDRAVIAALPEVWATVAAAFELAANETSSWFKEGEFDIFTPFIRELTPADASAALEGIIAKAIKAERDKWEASLSIERSKENANG